MSDEEPIHPSLRQAFDSLEVFTRSEKALGGVKVLTDLMDQHFPAKKVDTAKTLLWTLLRQAKNEGSAEALEKTKDMFKRRGII